MPPSVRGRRRPSPPASDRPAWRLRAERHRRADQYCGRRQLGIRLSADPLWPPASRRSRAVIAHRVLIEGQRPTAVAAAFGVCVRTVYKGVGRYRQEGGAGPNDRSSRPHRLGKFNRIGHVTGDRTGQSCGIGSPSTTTHAWLFGNIAQRDAALLSALSLQYLALLRHRRRRHKLPLSSTRQNADRLSISASVPGAKTIGKPNASSRPLCRNGPMPRPAKPRSSGPPTCGLAPLLQLASSAWLPEIQTASQQTRPDRRQLLRLHS